jgi:hypothetical protein
MTITTEHDVLIAVHSDADDEIAPVHTALVTIRQFVRIPSYVNGNGFLWYRITGKADADWKVLCQHIEGKALYTGKMCPYADIH